MPLDAVAEPRSAARETLAVAQGRLREEQKTLEAAAEPANSLRSISQQLEGTRGSLETLRASDAFGLGKWLEFGVPGEHVVASVATLAVEAWRGSEG